MRTVRIILVLAVLGLLGIWQLVREALQPELQAEITASVDKDQQSLPEVIGQYLLERKQQFTFTMSGYQDAEQSFKKAFAEAAAADDYTAYIIDSYHYTIRERSERADVEMAVRYRESAEQTAEVDRITTEALQKIVPAGAGMNDHEKVKAIHDWVIDQVEYDHSLSHYTAYEALSTGTTVCQGYALLVQHMLTKAGIESRIAEGTVSSGDHAWNLVKLDGNWYHLDATWDDAAPNVQAGQSDEAKDSAEATASRYRYYLLTDKQISRDHQWTKSYPEASSKYSETLTAKKAGPKQEEKQWAKLEAAIGLDWLAAERSAYSVDALTSRLIKMAHRGKSELQIRYTNGMSWSDDIRSAIRQAKIPDGYTVRSYPYGMDGSVLLHVTLLSGT